MVRIDSSGFGEDFGDKIGLGWLGRQRDRRVLEDPFEVSNLEGFSDGFWGLERRICSPSRTHNSDSIILDNEERDGGVTAGGRVLRVTGCDVSVTGMECDEASHAANGIGLTLSTNESTMDGFLTSAYHSYGSKPANHTLSSISLSDPPPAGEQPPSSSSYDYYPQDHQQQRQPPTHHIDNLQSAAPSPDLATRAADQITQENALDEEPLYVNAKQYYRILKRRVARARLEEVHRLSKQRKARLPLFSWLKF